MLLVLSLVKGFDSTGELWVSQANNWEDATQQNQETIDKGFPNPGCNTKQWRDVIEPNKLFIKGVLPRANIILSDILGNVTGTIEQAW